MLKYLISTSLFLCTLAGISQDRILVDGIFDEWDDYPTAYTDATGDAGSSGIDLGKLQINNDNDFLFFLLETGAEINLQDFNDINIYIDTDNNPTTGTTLNGIGAELVYSLGNRSGTYYGSGNPIAVDQNDIGLVSLPTVTSEIFEIAFKRNSSISGNSVFDGDTISVIIKDNASNGDVLPSTNGGVQYVFSTGSYDPLPTHSIQKSSESDLRIISYNVLSGGFFDQGRKPAFARILQAIQPDIIGFQEIYNYSSSQVASQVELMLPSGSGEQWYHAKEGNDCHAISRYEILKSANIPSYTGGLGNGAFLIDLPGNADLFLIVAHPPCCGNNSGRQIEVDLMMEFLRVSKAGNGPIPLTGNEHIVILGDMNLVGFRRQLETLLTGDIADESTYGADFNPDWDGSDLLDCYPFTTGLPCSFTWYSENSSFSPGKLDYILYSGSNLMLQNSYSLFTPGLHQDSITAYGLSKNDVVDASDHLPVVADFSIEETASLKYVEFKKPGNLKIQPNPAYDQIEISFKALKKDSVVIDLINSEGQLVSHINLKVYGLGGQSIKLNTSSFKAGLYFVRMKTSETTEVKKLVIVK